MFYKLANKDINNLMRVLSLATIKGVDAQKIIIISNVIQTSETKPYFQFEDDLREWILDTVDTFEIKGAEAPAIVDIQHAMTHPFKELPKDLAAAGVSAGEDPSKETPVTTQKPKGKK